MKKKEICQNFQRNKCKFSDNCKYLHIIPALSSDSSSLTTDDDESLKVRDDYPISYPQTQLLVFCQSSVSSVQELTLLLPPGVCRMFFHGTCEREPCPYTHSKGPFAPGTVHAVDRPWIPRHICRDFYYNRCNLGNTCRYKHTKTLDPNPFEKNEKMEVIKVNLPSPRRDESTGCSPSGSLSNGAPDAKGAAAPPSSEQRYGSVHPTLPPASTAPAPPPQASAAANGAKASAPKGAALSPIERHKLVQSSQAPSAAATSDITAPDTKGIVVPSPIQQRRKSAHSTPPPGNAALASSLQFSTALRDTKVPCSKGCAAPPSSEQRRQSMRPTRSPASVVPSQVSTAAAAKDTKVCDVNGIASPSPIEKRHKPVHSTLTPASAALAVLPNAT